MNENFYFVDSIQLAAAWIKQHEIEPLQVHVTYNKGIRLHLSLEDFCKLYSLEDENIKTYLGRDFIEYQIKHAEGMLIISCYKELS